MIRLTELEVRKIRMQCAMLVHDGRCRIVDDHGCRCLIRAHGHKGDHDFPWTVWTDVGKRQMNSAAT